MKRLALLLLLPAPGLADEPAIVVTGRPLAPPLGEEAYGSVIIPRARLTLSASDRLENVLGDVAGFAQFRRSDSRSTNPTAQGATLRGLGGNASSRALVLLDGVPQADPFFGSVPFSALVPDRLGSVRITRGGGTGPFGAGAVAGTIELSSAGRDDLPKLSGRADYGSFAARDASVGFAPDLGNGFVALSGRWERGDGFYTTPPDQRVVATSRARYRDWSANARAVVVLDGQTEVQARALIYRDNRTLRFVGADNSSSGEDASIRVIRRGRWQVDALAYVQARDFSTIVISATSYRKTLDQRATPSTGVGAKFEVRPPLGGGHVLRLGGDLRLSEGTAFEDAYSATTGLVTLRRSAGGRARTAGVFVEDSWRLGALTLTGGARLDHWTLTQGTFQETTAGGVATADTRFPPRRGSEVSGRVGATLALSEDVKLRAAAYTGFRTPTLNELYRPFTVFPVTTRANAALEPELLKGAEVGADLAVGQLRLGVTAFYNRLGNAIANVTIGTNVRQRQNVDAIVAKGLEFTGGLRIGPFDASASYILSDAKVNASGAAVALNGLRPAQTARHAGSATLNWSRQQGPSLSATLRYTGVQFEDDLQTDVLPAVLTVDGVARLPLGRHLAIIARAENVFDRTVVTRNSGGSIDTGTPRTVWIGVKFER